MIRKLINKLKGDKVIWVIFFPMIIFSLVGVYSFVQILARVEGGTPFMYMMKHALYVVVSIIAMLYVMKLPSVFFSKISPFLIVVSIGLLIYTFFFGQKVNGAGRWISIPIISLTFQASDVAKLSLILYLGYLLDKKKDLLHSWREGVLPILWPIVIVCVLIVKDNFSTAFIVFGISLVLLFIGNVSILKIASFVGVLVGMGFLAVMAHKALPQYNILPRYDTWENRILNRYSEKAVNDQNYIINNAQAKNAELGIFNGKLFGKGPGNGKVKEYIPEAYADFYYASLVEEYGLVGAIVLIFLYLTLFFRFMRIAIKAERIYEKITVIGIGISILSQALVNMLVCTGVFPVTGQNMPLLAMGGSALIATCVSIGIVQSIAAKYDKKTADKSAEPTDDESINEENTALA